MIFNINNIKTTLLFLIVCLAWGTTWITIKFSVESIPPLMSSGLRFLVAFPVFFMLAKINKIKTLPATGEIKFYCIATIFYFSIPFALINYGEIYLSSGLAALIFSSMPILILIFSHFMLHEKINIFQTVGIFLGFIGFFFILKSQGYEFDFKNSAGIIALFLAATMHAGYYVYVKKEGSKINSIAMNTLPLGIAGLILFTVGLIFEPVEINKISHKSIISVIYLGLFASVIGFIAYFELLKKISAVHISFVFLIFPVFALIFSSILEPQVNINLEFLVYFSLILFGFSITKIDKKP